MISKRIILLTALTMAAAVMAISLFSSCKKEQKSEQGVTQPAITTGQPAKPGAVPATEPTPPASQRPAMRDKASLILLYNTGVTGELGDCGCPHHPRGGLARRVQYALGLAKAQPAVVQVDGGSLFFKNKGLGGKADDADKAKAKVIAEGTAKMNMDAVNVSSLDLMAGADFLENTLARPEGALKAIPLISANLTRADTSDRIFPPYRIVESGGAKIGIFGIIIGQPLKGDTSVSIQDPEKATREMVTALRSDCDLLIGLFGGDLAGASKIVKNVPGVDIAVVGDMRGSPRDRPLVIGDSVITQAGNRGMYMGRMDIEMGGADKEVMPEQEREQWKEQLSRLEAQSKILEGSVQRDPEFRTTLAQNHRKESEIRDKLARAGYNFTYKNSMVSIDLDLPEDQETASAVKAALDEWGDRRKTR